MRKEEEEKKA